MHHEPDQVASVVADGAKPPQASQFVRQSDLRIPADVLRPAPSGRSGSVKESTHSRAGRRLRSARDRAEPQSEPDHDHLRETSGLSAPKDTAVGRELPATELDSPEDPQGLQDLGDGARRQSLRDEAVRESGRLRHLHGTLHRG